MWKAKFKQKAISILLKARPVLRVLIINSDPLLQKAGKRAMYFNQHHQFFNADLIYHNN